MQCAARCGHKLHKVQLLPSHKFCIGECWLLSHFKKKKSALAWLHLVHLGCVLGDQHWPPLVEEALPSLLSATLPGGSCWHYQALGAHHYWWWNSRWCFDRGVSKLRQCCLVLWMHPLTIVSHGNGWQMLEPDTCRISTSQEPRLRSRRVVLVHFV